VEAHWCLGEDNNISVGKGAGIEVGMLPSAEAAAVTASTLWGASNQSMLNFQYTDGITRKKLFPLAVDAAGVGNGAVKMSSGKGSMKAYYDFGRMLESNRSLKYETESDLYAAGLYSNQNMVPPSQFMLSLFTMVDTTNNKTVVSPASAAMNYNLQDGTVEIVLKMYTRLYPHSNWLAGGTEYPSLLKKLIAEGEAVGANGGKPEAMEEAEYDDEEEEAVVCASQAQGRHCTCGHGVDRTGCEA